MKYKFETIFSYAIMFFVYLLTVIFGFDRVKKLGYCILTKYADKPCDECKKTNIFRKLVE